MRNRLANPVFWAKALQCTLLCVIAFTMLGAGESRYDHIGHELMCSCGCGQGLLECNHVGCPSSPVMIEELRTQIASGVGDNAILNWFIAKYGATVLAAPIRGGFDNAAWIVPFSVFALATVGTFAIVWMWKRRYGAAATPALADIPHNLTPDDAALRERIRRETEYGP